VKLLAESIAWICDAWHSYLSPAMPRLCRFEPSCSKYAAEALRRHGLIKGLGLSLGRFLRCHPFGSHGFDPVPKRNP
jgi:putative membrane protein insertion efficiency factor